MTTTTKQHFKLGQIVMTQGAQAALEEIAENIIPLDMPNRDIAIRYNVQNGTKALLIMHSELRQGTLCNDDHKLNKQACATEGQRDKDGHLMQERILSSYEIENTKFWVITEYDRSVTTLLLPSEY